MKVKSVLNICDCVEDFPCVGRSRKFINSKLAKTDKTVRMFEWKVKYVTSQTSSPNKKIESEQPGENQNH